MQSSLDRNIFVLFIDNESVELAAAIPLERIFDFYALTSLAFSPYFKAKFSAFGEQVLKNLSAGTLTFFIIDENVGCNKLSCYFCAYFLILCIITIKIIQKKHGFYGRHSAMGTCRVCRDIIGGVLGIFAPVCTFLER